VRFHVEIAAAALAGARRMRALAGIDALALSGGVLQNALLRELLLPPLAEAGFRVFTNVRIPPGDGGLAVGQAYFEGS
jgi:hydrogenase maturation protein HypF